MALTKLQHRAWTSVLFSGTGRAALSTHARITGFPRHASTTPQGPSRSSGLNHSHPSRHTTPAFINNITKSLFASPSPAANHSTHSQNKHAAMADKLQSVTLREQLAGSYPWTTTPLIISAPMRVMSGPELAVAVSASGGIGFIGPGEKPSQTALDLETAKSLLASSPNLQQHFETSGTLPIGIGIQLWNGDLPTSASTLAKYHPAISWLFAPRNGQTEIDAWTSRLREASPQTKIWLQIGTLREALDAVSSPSPPDVLVVQGAEAGGHGRAVDGIGFITLLPEIADAIRASGSEIPLIAAGGVADGRGVVAALGVGAAGVAMGTRFLASREARIKRGYQDEVVRASDGGANTVRTHLYNHLRGTFGWPEQFSPRTIVNRAWAEQQAGTPFEEIKKRHDEAVAKGDAAWGPEGWTATYAGANVGLVRSVAGAADIVDGVRHEAAKIIQALSGL